MTMFNNRRGAKDNNNRMTQQPLTDKIYKILLRGLEKNKSRHNYYNRCRLSYLPMAKGRYCFQRLKNKCNASSYQHKRQHQYRRFKNTVFRKCFTGCKQNTDTWHKSRLYNYFFNDIKLKSDERSFAVERLHIVPLLGEAAFMRAYKWQTDRLDFDLYNLLFKQVNVQEILDGNLIANELKHKKGQP